MATSDNQFDDDLDIDYYDYDAAIANHLSTPKDNRLNERLQVDEDSVVDSDPEDNITGAVNGYEEKTVAGPINTRNMDSFPTESDPAIARGLQDYDATGDDVYMESDTDDCILIHLQQKELQISISDDDTIARNLQEDEDSIADSQSKVLAEVLYEEETVAAAARPAVAHPVDNKESAESDMELARRLQMEEDEALAHSLHAHPTPTKAAFDPRKYSHAHNSQRNQFSTPSQKAATNTAQEQSDIEFARKLQMEEDESIAQTMQQENGAGRTYNTHSLQPDGNGDWLDDSDDELAEDAFGTVTLTPNGLSVQRRSQRLNPRRGRGRGTGRGGGRGRWRIDTNVPGHLAQQLQDRVGDFGEDDYDMLLMLAEQLGDVNHEGMKEGDIGRLPTTTVRVTPSGTDDADCKVCFECLDVGQDVRILPCCHRFHVECIDTWLKTKASCPICQLSIKDELRGRGGASP